MNFSFSKITGYARLSILFLFIFGSIACKKDTGVKQDAPVSVQVIHVDARAAAQQYSYPGNIEGLKRITLSTKVMGQIVSLPYQEGTAVKAGQVLARIKNDDLLAKRAQIAANRDEANAALTNITANYERIRDLYEKKSATRKELDDVTMALDMAKAKMKAIAGMDDEVNDVIRYATILAPIDGTIVGRYSEEGNIASPGMPILAIEDTRTLKVAISVPESEIALFKIGSPVGISIDALGNSTMARGSITEINSEGNPGSHQFQVKAAIQSPAAGIKSGMYATVLLSGGGQSVITLPESILTHRGGLDGLYIVTKDNEALLRWVRTGKTFADGTIEILSGVAQGETIISNPSDQIKDGSAVKVSQ